MSDDMTANCDEGLLNIRVGAIIIKDGKFLMVSNDNTDYYYSVGGRIKFGETAQEAVVREVFEETGVRLQADRLGFIHENYFYGDSLVNRGKLIYEISFYFYMIVPDDFSPVCDSKTADGHDERLVWIDETETRKVYPEFFMTELSDPKNYIIHTVTNDRK